MSFNNNFLPMRRPKTVAFFPMGNNAIKFCLWMPLYLIWWQFWQNQDDSNIWWETCSNCMIHFFHGLNNAVLVVSSKSILRLRMVSKFVLLWIIMKYQLNSWMLFVFVNLMMDSKKYYIIQSSCCKNSVELYSLNQLIWLMLECQ